MSRTRRTTGALLGLALLGTLTAGAVPAAAAPSGPDQDVIVRVSAGSLDAVAERVEQLGGTVTHRLGIIDSLAVEAPASTVAALRADRRVQGISEDAGVELASTTYDASSDSGSMYSVTSVTGTRNLWKSATGKGIDVALIDSGVTPVEGLATPGKVVYGPDLSFESQSADTRNLDTFGHGTHMAGIIAGRDSDVSMSSVPTANQFVGMAPESRIVSVKVADAYGATDISQVIAGIDWVVQHKSDPGFNIRVLNLSFGTPSTQSYLLDPLAHAAEQAWHKGVVVVVSAGNDGTGTGKLLNPAQDPYVVAVGAEKSNGTMGISDDVVPDFSSRGDGQRNPDLVAPGASVQSLRVPGSWIDDQYPTARLGDRYFRGSGTSQAAAVVSGAAALLLQARPSLTPDQVKHLLRNNAAFLNAADSQAQGKGLLKVDKAYSGYVTTVTQTHQRSTGTGSLDAARGGYRVTLDGVELTGEKDVFGKAFSSSQHAAAAEAGTAWTDGTWNGSTWTGRMWASNGWESASWTGTSWSGRLWAGRLWAAGAWNGRLWANQSWTSGSSVAADGTLNGRMWAGRMWAGGGWK